MNLQGELDAKPYPSELDQSPSFISDFPFRLVFLQLAVDTLMASIFSQPSKKFRIQE